MMKADTIEKDGDVINRQLQIDSTVYKDADALLVELNRELGLISRNKKMFLKDFLPILIADGVKFRKGKVFTPYHLAGKFARDDKWIRLKTKAEESIKILKEHESKIALKKD